MYETLGRVIGTVIGLVIALAGIAFIRYTSDTPPDAIAMNRVGFGVLYGVPICILGLFTAIGASLGRMDRGFIWGLFLGPGMIVAYAFVGSIWFAR